MLGLHSLSELSISELRQTAAIVPPTDILLGGGPGYTNHWERRLREEQEERRKELLHVEEQIFIAEEKLQEVKLSSGDEEAAQLAGEETRLLQEINRLRMVRVWLMRLLDDEEAILAILMSWPLH